MITYLDTEASMAWLQEVHEVPSLGCACAMIHGNEDAPEKIELFAINDYRCPPDTYVPANGGGYTLQTTE